MHIISKTLALRPQGKLEFNAFKMLNTFSKSTAKTAV